jgi:hypothetical protein
MNAPKTRGAAIAANCRDCIGDAAAGGTWREQVSCCASTSCPFWTFRPLSGNAPAWITSRNPDDLPADWKTLPHDEAIRRLRGNGDDNANGCAVQANGGVRAPDPMQPPCPTPALAETHASDGVP